MKPEKIPASSFPKIPVNLLMRIIEEWSLPRKNQSLPKCSTDARRLAMRLRKTQASLRNDSGATAADSDTWLNVSDYLTAAMGKNDFKTLEAFCEGFMEFSATAKVMAEGEAGALQLLKNNNGEASAQIVAVARAILILQDRKRFPPYQSEIIDYLSDWKRRDGLQYITTDKLSKILKDLKLTPLLPKLRMNP